MSKKKIEKDRSSVNSRFPKQGQRYLYPTIRGGEQAYDELTYTGKLLKGLENKIQYAFDIDRKNGGSGVQWFDEDDFALMRVLRD